MGTYDRQFEAARRAVGEASEVCRRVQRDLDRVRAIAKDDRSPVTVADFASQAVVATILSETLGPVRLVAEEASTFLRDPAHAGHLAATVEAVRSVVSGATEDQILAAIDLGAAEPAPEGFWTLDPVDGTKGFLRGQQYAVSLAYLRNWLPVVGVLGCPNLPSNPALPLEAPGLHGCTFGAVAGEGLNAWAAGGTAGGVLIPRRAPLPESALITVCSSVEESHTDSALVDRLIGAAAPHATPLRLDSQCKYAIVARGQADLYLRIPRGAYIERIWDHAAGALIAQEAGCLVSDLAGNPLDFSCGRGLERNRGIVCAPSGLHARVLAAARAVA